MFVRALKGCGMPENDNDSRRVDAQLKLSAFMVDERPVVFIRDDELNRRFLHALDHDYWRYQAQVHYEGLSSDVKAVRQRAATALRVAYSQGLETLFALLGAFIQAPNYSIGWLSTYRNRELRAVVEKIHCRQALPCALNAWPPSWSAISGAIHEHIPAEDRTEVSKQFAALWRRLAGEFLAEDFEPEYNHLKHGMRAHVGGFSLAVGLTPQSGEPPPEMTPIGSTEYGSTISIQRKLPGYKYTFELGHSVSLTWVPEQFVGVLHLISMSVQNIVSAALIASGIVESQTLRFAWPRDSQAFDAPWRVRPSIGRFGMGVTTVEIPGWVEPSEEEIRNLYPKRRGGTLQNNHKGAAKPGPAPEGHSDGVPE